MTTSTQPNPTPSSEVPEAMLNRMRYYAEIVSRESTPDGERRMFAERLAALQTKYSLEEWQLYQDAKATITPQVRTRIFIAPSGHPLSFDLAQLANFSGQLFNVKVHFNGMLSRKEYLQGYNLEATAMGFETDLLMWEATFTKIHLYMFEMLSPTVNPDLSFDENVYRFHRAGLTWPQMADVLNAYLSRTSADEIPQGWPTTVNARDGKLKRSAIRVYKTNGETYAVHKNPVAYRKSFANGYVGRIVTRLREAIDAVRSTGSDLVLASKYDVVKTAHSEKFGAMSHPNDPHATKPDPMGFLDGVSAANKINLPTNPDPNANQNANQNAKGSSEIAS